MLHQIPTKLTANSLSINVIYITVTDNNPPPVALECFVGTDVLPPPAAARAYSHQPKLSNNLKRIDERTLLLSSLFLPDMNRPGESLQPDTLMVRRVYPATSTRTIGENLRCNEYHIWRKKARRKCSIDYSSNVTSPTRIAKRTRPGTSKISSRSINCDR